MTNTELIQALRDKASRDNRALLDEAANVIERLTKPPKTIKDDFLEKYPKARMDAKDVPIICVNHLGYCVECSDICSECWNRPLSEVQK